LKNIFVITVAIFLFFSGIASAIPTEGLVAYYPFNGNSQDESGNGNNGTVHGAVLAPDRFGNPNSAYSFDGMDDFIELTQIDLPTTYTIAFWINPDSIDPSGDIKSELISRDDENVRCYYSALDYSGKLVNSVIGPDGTTQYRTDDVVVSTGAWQFVVITYDGNTGPNEKVTFYVNGTTFSSSRISYYDSGGPPNTGPLTTKIGTNGAATKSFFDGYMDDVRIYNRIISQDEINQLRNEGFPDDSDGLIAFYSFNGNA